MMPNFVAIGTSMLSTPTPARPTTLNCLVTAADSNTFLVTFVALRTTKPS